MEKKTELLMLCLEWMDKEGTREDKAGRMAHALAKTIGEYIIKTFAQGIVVGSLATFIIMYFW